ncbi:MAG: leucine-rich repeat domain-containing protein [Prevotellaceae bacterium]|nr:leucine-rich repeat domain-containing protein [Prevotellaceae bacterium]
MKVDKKNGIYDSREDCNAVVETSRARIVAGCGSTKIVKGVHEIGEFAFYNTSLSHIFIPSTVFRIGEDAFSYCKFCTSISVSRDNSVYHSDDGCNAIIERVTGRLVQGCAGTVISDAVKELGSHSFAGVTVPSTFVIPEEVMKIDRYAFSDCTSLKCVVFSGFSARVEWNAFSRCTQLGYVFLPDNIGQIDKGAFRDCPYEKLFMEYIKK